MSDLKTNYKNDVLDITMDGKRRYEQVENSDGTVSLVDKTVYTQLGDNLGADDINAQNTAINTLNNNLGQMGSAELLVESDVTKSATISNLSNYRYIYIELSNTAQTAVYATNNIPIELFKRGISYISYCNGSFGEYGTVKYISDTTINIIVNASNIICRVYGTK